MLIVGNTTTILSCSLAQEGAFALLSGTSSYHVSPSCTGPMPPPVNGAVYTFIWD